MAESSLAKKLLLRPGQRVLIIDPPPGYLDRLGTLPEGSQMADGPDSSLDFVHLFVKTGADLARQAPDALRAVKTDGLLWVSYPKKSSKIETDLTRDSSWAPLFQVGMRPVTQVAIDETWSAVRFRKTELVGQKTTK